MSAEWNNMKKAVKSKISYEPEADVLTWELTDEKIDYAEHVGDVIVHFTKKNTPVIIEILEASKFLKKGKNPLQSSLSAHRKALVSLR